jgi:nucleotide-binding universal stress UspA family protein
VKTFQGLQMTSTTRAPVVVGVDGSDAGLTAVRLAVRIAAGRHRPLRVVHAFTWPLVYLPVGPARHLPPEGPLREHADRIIEQAEACAHRHDPHLHVTSDLAVGGAAQVLIEQSREAAVVVLGDRGHGWFAGLLLGSVAVQVAMHAAGPVVVARGHQRIEGPIVVGVDGSPTCAPAIAFAAEQAVLRHTHLVAVHAWTQPAAPAVPADLPPLAYDVEHLAAQQARVLAESVAWLPASHPDLAVEQTLVGGRPAPVLIAQSHQAQMVVVGARGHGGFAGLLLGAVSHALLHHADCPVAVVRQADTR